MAKKHVHTHAPGRVIYLSFCVVAFQTVVLNSCLLLSFLLSLRTIGSLHLAGNELRGTIPTVLSKIDSLSKCLSFVFLLVYTFYSCRPFVFTYIALRLLLLLLLLP